MAEVSTEMSIASQEHNGEENYSNQMKPKILNQNSGERYFRSIAVIPTPMSQAEEFLFSKDNSRRLPGLNKFNAISPAPEPEPSMEMPTPPMQPTTIPENWKAVSSSSLIPVFSSVVESTMEIKNATEKP